MIKHRLKIIDIRNEGNNTKTFFLEKPSDFSWDEGSHTHIALNNYEVNEVVNKSFVRHMSIMTLAQENKVGFTTRFPNEMSEYKSLLANYQIGDEINLFKIGSRMKLRREDKRIVLLSMGVGIATMRPLILAYNKDRTKVSKLIHINVDSNPTIYKDEIDSYVNDQFINFWTRSRVDYFQKLTDIINKENTIYYIVGSDTFLRTNIQKLKLAGVSVDNIMIDKKDGILNLYYDF